MAGGVDLLVGIDVGMSCTGVAYLNLARGVNKVHIFNKWPGHHKAESKVPTCLKYRKGSPQPSSWGFQCDGDDQGEPEEWFKADFALSTTPRERKDRTCQLYKDYLGCLYNEIRGHFDPTLLNGKTWEAASIHFLFSVPTTWDLSLVDEFHELARSSGFGGCPRHKLETSLTEPHAVAAYTLSQERFIKASSTIYLYIDNENILIIDAGSSTVDLCLLHITDVREGKVNMTEIKPVQGTNCGSTFIDSGFQDIIANRLNQLQPPLDASITKAWDMSRSPNFQSTKEDVGRDVWSDDDIFQIAIPAAGSSMNHESLQIVQGKMEFRWSELKRLFDTQISQIIKLVEKIMGHWQLHKATRFTDVHHIILSGGLGSSKYVQDQLSKFLEASDIGALKQSKLHQSTQPQLAVCLGLVEHASQSLKGETMFVNRLSQSSLGIACQIRIRTSLPTSSRRDILREAKSKEMVRKDSAGHDIIDGYMDWFVKRGDSIREGKTIHYEYSVEFEPSVDESRRVAWVPIMTSNQDPIPRFNDRGTVRSLKMLEADLSQVSPSSIAQKHKIFKIPGKKSNIRVSFLIEAEVGVADVKFRCLDCKTRRVLGKDTSVDMQPREIIEPMRPSEIIRDNIL
ncbi:hypothetical protein B0I35DRAFT_515681 [Stachybotrys elegans]|uniref:Uncharacterized protein n=1 Tax=Stachybotrys elegans TaxID=80388 RepID=A0A8K0SIJ3_9HYPO|nr:hypothetical protein B0I35DRAFT_515681 [Stachybotrys elegans]